MKQILSEKSCGTWLSKLPKWHGKSFLRSEVIAQNVEADCTQNHVFEQFGVDEILLKGRGLKTNRAGETDFV